MSRRGVYKMRTVVRLTGFSPAVLRAWETRHGLLAPARAPKGHRLYTEDDLAVLRRVRQLIDEGRSIGEIALAGRSALLEQAPRGAEPSPAPAGLATLRDALVAGACAIDAAAVDRALDQAFAGVSTEVAIHEVLEPAAYRIGELWAAGRCSVAGEHLASELMNRRIGRLLEAARPANGVPGAICACWPDELHALGARIVALHLARRGVPVAYLGAALPFDDLDRACQVLRPRGCWLSVERSELVRPQLARFRALCAAHPAVRVVVGGPGAAKDRAALEAAGAAVAVRPAEADPAAWLRDTIARLDVPRNARKRR